MADSDSEAFESADEEVEEKKHSKTEKVSHHVKSAKVEAEVPEEPTNPPQQSQSSWRSWGAFSVISNASKTVASITTQVSQSISTAIDSINIPEPEEMAKQQAEQRKISAESASAGTETPSDDSRFKLDNLLSGVTQISSKVVSGGLDTLEGIGKKTINILQDTDPNIKNKLRGLATSGSKPNLSELLKEAKEREDEVVASASIDSAIQVSFEHLLDEYKGLVFLEALEILSHQSKMKIEMFLKPLTGKTLNEMEETLQEVKELCEFDAESFDESLTEENLESKLRTATEDLSVKLNFCEILNFTVETRKILDENNGTGADTYNKSIDIMAKTCALSLNNLQKLAELLLSLDHRSTADEADSLTQLATIYCSLFNLHATKFSEKFAIDKNPESKKMSTNLFLESSNAIGYIKKAFNLFIPILQIGAI